MYITHDQYNKLKLQDIYKYCSTTLHVIFVLISLDKFLCLSHLLYLRKIILTALVAVT